MWLQEREFGVDSDAFIVSVGRKTGNTGAAQATLKDGNTVHAAVGVRDYTNARDNPFPFPTHRRARKFTTS